MRLLPRSMHIWKLIEYRQKESSDEMRMPAIFVGHGSPMNAIEDNAYTREWAAIGRQFHPKGILMISGHWYTNGLKLQSASEPKKINDMYGFPDALYQVAYDVKGDSGLIDQVQGILGEGVDLDDSWGIDHGTWAVLTHMYPHADVPVVQLSLDRTKSPEALYELGQKLARLRDQGYMILASGNVVHNLRAMNPSMNQTGYEWAQAFDDAIEKAVSKRDFETCLNYKSLGEPATLSVPTAEHYLPLVTLLGATKPEDSIQVFNKGFDLGGVSMTGYVFK